jgi:hypothetical protein
MGGGHENYRNINGLKHLLSSPVAHYVAVAPGASTAMQFAGAAGDPQTVADL